MTTAPVASAGRGELVRVALHEFKECDSLPFDLHVSLRGEGQLRLLGKRGYPLSQTDLDRLAARGIDTLYISSSDMVAYQQLLGAPSSDDASHSPAQRLTLVRETVRGMCNDAIARGDVPAILAATGEFSRQLVDIAGGGESNLYEELFEVLVHDYDTFNHMTNVTCYCVLLAVQLGIEDREELAALAQGALLHDVGKRFIHKDVLHKPGRLTLVEQKLVRQHPQRGFETLCHRPELAWGALMMVYQHHERCDGRGYPVGLTGREIHPWAKICAVADVFDALTRDRPYREAVGRRDVLEYFDREGGRGFDEEMIRCWIEVMS